MYNTPERIQISKHVPGTQFEKLYQNILGFWKTKEAFLLKSKNYQMTVLMGPNSLCIHSVVYIVHIHADPHLIQDDA